MDIQKKKIFLLDMDGTLYIDEKLFSGTLPFLDEVRRIGARALYLTNNSSKGIDAYLAKLARLGISASADDFVTSVDATIAYILAHEANTLFYVLGTASLCRQLESAGIRVTTERDTPGIGGLLMGYDTELTYRKLEDACILLRDEIVYLATNPDSVCPAWYGSAPDCGSFACMLQTATGKLPYVIGKPKPDMIYLALERTGCRPEDAVIIGDRVNTDIASGCNAGIDSILVLSGEGTVADAEQAETKPTLILRDIGEVAKALCAR